MDRNADELRVSGLASPGVSEVRILDPICESEWDQSVATHRDCNFFHTSAWARVLCRTYGHKPLFLKLSKAGESRILLPLMEVASPFTGRRGVCLPFSDFCHPLLFDGWEQESLMEGLVELGRNRKWRYFELRGGREMLPPSATAAEKYYGHKLDLTIGIEELFARFQGPVRRAIRKAEKSGLTVEASKTRESMLDFYRLHVRTRRRHGVPPQPLTFFLNIHREIVKADQGLVIVAKSGTKPVAAAVFFYAGKAALFKFGASDDRIQAFRGNNLVMWEGIKRLVGKGVKTMHFGRTTMSDEGLRRFKLSWGTKEEIIEYFKFAFGPNLWVNTRRDVPDFCNQLFGRLPLAVNRLAGALVYRHLD